jgi:geranylgeranyl diphosphate synthase type I
LLGIWGRPEVTGKSSWNDLRQRKKSVPVVAALTSGRAEAGRLAELYAAPGDLTEDQLVAAARLVEEAGGRDRAEAEAQRHLDLALGCLDGLGIPEVTRTDLAALAAFTTTREL